MSSEASSVRLRLLAGIASDLLAAERPDQLLGDLCDRVHAHLGLDVVLYYGLEGSGDRQTLVLRSFSGLDPPTAASIERIEVGSGLCGAVAARGTPTIVDAAHLQVDPDDHVLKALGLGAVACHPLIGPQGVLGTLVFGSRRHRPLDDEELWAMATVASLAVLAIGKRRAALALEETESRLAIANRAAEQGLWEIDLAESVVTLSDKARELFGVSPDAPFKRRTEWRQLVYPEDRQSLMEAIDNARGGADYQVEFRVRRPSDGAVRWILARGRLLPGTTRMVGVLSDVTEARAATEAQRRALEALREEDRRKSEFIAILSHELRNPLTPVVYALPVIERAPLDPEAARALAVVRRQVGHLGRLVDDLLDISRISSGKVELRREVMPLAQVVEAAVESAGPLVKAMRHRLEVALPEAPLWVEADPHRLAQVLTNLLTNAARYTPRGGRIWLRVRQEDGRAVLRVKDTGIGIRPEHASRLFEMFQQIHQEEGPRGGLGIGLALARRLIVMHGGTIEAYSEGAGKGTEFVVALPLAQARAEAPARAREPGHRAAGRLRVLVVDDNVDLVEMLATMVAEQGHHVRKALDGPSALTAARAFRPDVVLLDIGLPIMSGLEVARRFRAEPETRHARLIALTGWGQDEDRERTREAGFDEHLTKPTDPDALMQMLTEIAAKKGQR